MSWSALKCEGAADVCCVSTRFTSVHNRLPMTSGVAMCRSLVFLFQASKAVSFRLHCGPTGVEGEGNRRSEVPAAQEK